MTHARIVKKLSLDVDFEIASGVTALFGPPGAGKTLVLEAIAGFVTPDSGRILRDDVILFDAESRVNVPPSRRNCGYVLQHDALFPHMTERQNLMFAAQRYPRLERHRRVTEMSERFAGANLEIARALIAEPKLLLLDDRNIDEPLLRLIRSVTAVPILLVTHDLDLCSSAADQLLILDAGRILQRGAPGEVIDRPESVEAARLLGIPNLFEGTIAALDPGRNTSRLEFEGFALTAAPYLPGHLRGDRIWVAVRADALRVNGGGPNTVTAQLVRASHRTRYVRLEFSGSIFVDVSHEEFARRKDDRTWQVEFPPEALRIL